MAKILRALLSVFNKEGLPGLARGLRRFNIDLLSSGGTASLLENERIPVTRISEYTGAPEILGGRVKTLHPKISGGILARETEEHLAQLKEHQIDTIDLVVVNLYPFEQTLARPGATIPEIIEMIDIGGPTLIRAAAKNHERVGVVVDPADYDRILAELERGEGSLSPELKRELAGKAFTHTAAYDGVISNFFHSRAKEGLPEVVNMQLRQIQPLRYGENPHQGAALYANTMDSIEPAIVNCEKLQGKHLSYNNILDSDAALNLILELPGSAVCILKHTNPCGAAFTDGDLAEAFRKALATDPVSAFGGIVACNESVTAELAEELKDIFLEAVIAPDFEPRALALLAKKKKLRLLRFPREHQQRQGLQMKSVSGGMLIQEFDGSIEELGTARVATRRGPTTQEMKALSFAWRICKHVKSNAIVFSNADQLVGVGAGQMSRVDSVKLAAAKAQIPLQGSVMASDAFFPFRDGVDEAAKVGVTAVVQPGGSIRDEEVIAAADEHGMAMILTGQRHFRH